MSTVSVRKSRSAWAVEGYAPVVILSAFACRLRSFLTMFLLFSAGQVIAPVAKVRDLQD